MDILHRSYLTLLAKTKWILVLSYIVAVCIFIASLFLPSPADLPDNADFATSMSYVGVFLVLWLIINIVFYRPLATDTQSFGEILPRRLFSATVKMALYLAFLLFLMFLAQLSLSLLIGIIVAIVNNVSGAEILNEANLPPVVYFLMLVVTLLILMRLQPTLFSVAAHRTHVPMKDAFYYTRDNTKQIILIGLLSFIPSMMPLLIVVSAVTAISGLASAGGVVTLVIFPLFLLPYVAVMSAGIEISNYLLPANTAQSEGD